MSESIFLLTIISAYLVGSIPFAILVSRVSNLPDPRSFGSGNPGATNVLRTGNKFAAAITLVADAFKGYIAVVACTWLVTLFDATVWITTAVALAAFLGHLFPIYLKFRGGKGVATGLGVLIALNWHIGVMAMFFWLLVAYITRYSSLAAIVSLICTLVFTFFLDAIHNFVAVFFILIFVILKHKQNIQNLVSGNESKISFNSK